MTPEVFQRSWVKQEKTNKIKLMIRSTIPTVSVKIISITLPKLIITNDPISTLKSAIKKRIYKYWDHSYKALETTLRNKGLRIKFTRSENLKLFQKRKKLISTKLKIILLKQEIKKIEYLSLELNPQKFF